MQGPVQRRMHTAPRLKYVMEVMTFHTHCALVDHKLEMTTMKIFSTGHDAEFFEVKRLTLQVLLPPAYHYKKERPLKEG